MGSVCSLAASTTTITVLYVVAVMVETSCHPYDVLEAEPEVVSGYYVDCGGYVFMLVYLGEGVVIHHHMHSMLLYVSSDRLSYA